MNLDQKLADILPIAAIMLLVVILALPFIVVGWLWRKVFAED